MNEIVVEPAAPLLKVRVNFADPEPPDVDQQVLANSASVREGLGFAETVTVPVSLQTTYVFVFGSPSPSSISVPSLTVV